MMVNFCISGGGDVCPPGFRFHPTDEELVLYYLKGMICGKRNRLDVIGETDVYKWDPEDLPGMSKLKTGDRVWFFFTPRDRKYPNGMRSKRATGHGYWKVTGNGRVIKCGSRAVGIKKTLIFYRGRALSGERTDWVMHEYTMDEDELKRCQTDKQYYALYKVYKKSGAGPKNGEQYGALFVEEDWDEIEDNLCIGQKSVVNGANESAPTINVLETVDTSGMSTLHKPEGILNEIPVEPIPSQQKAFHYEYALDQFADKDGIRVTSVEHAYGNVYLPVPETFCQPSDLPTSFDPTQSGTTQLQFGKAPEGSSVPINDVLGPVFSEQDFIEMDDLIGQENVVNGANESAPTINVLETVDTSGMSTLHKPEGILNEIPVEPILSQQKAFDYEDALDQLTDKDGIRVTSVEHARGNVYLPVPEIFCQPSDVPTSFDVTQSGNTRLQFGEAPEVSSVPIHDVLGPVFNEEHFIEMDDLIGPDPTSEILDTSVNSMEDLQLNELGCLPEVDIFQDALCDMGHVGATHISELYASTFDNGVLDPISNSCLNNVENSSGNYSLQQQFDDYDGVSYQLWTNGQSNIVATDAEPNLGLVAPSVSGVLHENQNQMYGFTANEDGNRRQDDGSHSWFSSALWSFVESIPTIPASASESPLVNRAFNRISSFSRIRINNPNMKNTNVGGQSYARKSRIGFICISVVGVLCGLVWMLNWNTPRI